MKNIFLLMMTVTSCFLVFSQSNKKLSWTTEGLIKSDVASSGFGRSVSSAGDVNGDGFDDLIVGAGYRKMPEDQHDYGAAFIYYGSECGIDPNNPIILEIDIENSLFGRSVSDAGDVNGDGYDDVIIGAYMYNEWGTYGRAFVYYGGVNGIEPNNYTYLEGLEGTSTGNHFGLSVSGAGDVNGDGYDDVIVGAPRASLGQIREGAAYVYHGGAMGVNPAIASTLQANKADAYMGHCVSGARDINNDGYDDVIVGASRYSYNNAETYDGAVFVYHGSSNGIGNGYSAMITSEKGGGTLGSYLSDAGDVNNDGYDDIIVGSPGYENGEENEGAALVYLGGIGGINTMAAVKIEGNVEDATMGAGVSSIGDINNDGFDDVIIGAFYYLGGLPNDGSVQIHYGNSNGIDTIATIKVESNQDRSHLGWGVGHSGDVNGDGYIDVIVGDQMNYHSESTEGVVHIFHGNEEGIQKSSEICRFSELDFIIYPNPSEEDYFKIRYNGVIHQVKIFDILGRLVPSSFEAEGKIIEVSNLSDGKYIVQLHTDEGVRVCKVVVL